MFIQQGKPLPPELVPLSMEQMRYFVDLNVPLRAILAARDHASRLQSEWVYMNNETKIKLIEKFFDILFLNSFPKPIHKVTFSRLRFTATFHSEDWSMRFSENHFAQDSFEKTFKVWIHESYHAMLHFYSLRVNLPIAADVFSPPPQVIQMAQQYKMPDDGSVTVIIAKRNLLGMIDRSIGGGVGGNYRSVRIGDRMTMVSSPNTMGGVGWDSYYLNVEINVETLTEITFKKIFPNYMFRRSYVTAEEYIQRRLSGVAPIYAAI
jgi:hypothetical protein